MSVFRDCLDIIKAPETSGKKVVFWGAGPKVPRLRRELCDDGFLQTPSLITDSTRNLSEEEYGIPSIPFESLKDLDPAEHIFVITAGLLDLQAHVIRNGLYYHDIVDHRSLELATYLAKNYPGEERVTLVQRSRLLASEESQILYMEIANNILKGIVWNPAIADPNPYFGNRIVSKLAVGNTVFAGAFNGRHIDRMIRKEQPISLLAFEPNPDFAESTSDLFSSVSHVEVRNGLLSDRDGTLDFYRDRANNGLAARVVNAAGIDTVALPTVRLDSIFSEENSLENLILDVEGHEPQVIRGASSTIKSHRPSMAICIYHNPHDFVEIVEMISKLDLGYKFEILHHSPVTSIETVLYCIPPEDLSHD